MLLSLYETMTIYKGPEGAVIIVQDNDHLLRARKRYGDPFGATDIINAANLFSNGIPIYPSTWSDTGNPFYYILCTYLISMNNYCYHDCLCNIYYHYFNLYSFSYL